MGGLELVDRVFFDGWRKRIGSLTLLMTLPIALAWVLSPLISFELFNISEDQTMDSLTSSPNGIAWASAYQESNYPLRRICIPWISSSVGYPNMAINIGRDATWQLDFCGFRSASNDTHSPNRQGFWTIPHWAIVLPLTLLSAYLLLMKPRVAKSKKTVEPTTADERESWANSSTAGDGRLAC